MLDLLDETTTKTTISPADTETPAAYTEEQARDYLDNLADTRPSIRALGGAWGWDKSKVQRFLARLANETASETRAETATVSQADAETSVMSIASGSQADGDDFDWLNDDSVLLREQQNTAVYFNGFGAMVIRQDRTCNQDEDSYVVIAENNVAVFVDKLCEVIGIPSAGSERQS